MAWYDGALQPDAPAGDLPFPGSPAWFAWQQQQFQNGYAPGYGATALPVYAPAAQATAPPVPLAPTVNPYVPPPAPVPLAPTAPAPAPADPGGPAYGAPWAYDPGAGPAVPWGGAAPGLMPGTSPTWSATPPPAPGDSTAPPPGGTTPPAPPPTVSSPGGVVYTPGGVVADPSRNWTTGPVRPVTPYAPQPGDAEQGPPTGARVAPARPWYAFAGDGNQQDWGQAGLSNLSQDQQLFYDVNPSLVNRAVETYANADPLSHFRQYTQAQMPGIEQDFARWAVGPNAGAHYSDYVQQRYNDTARGFAGLSASQRGENPLAFGGGAGTAPGRYVMR